MQTFLPFEDFDASMRVLDQARLGKQRVETLQVLRSLLLPSYGWQNHPVSRMWRGFVPGLTAYGLSNVREWTARGHADSTSALIREFAPEVDGLTQEALAARGLLPRWVGDEEVHRSHRSNLIRKDPSFYEPLFPGTPGDLEYVWPGVGIGTTTGPELGDPVWIVRAQDDAELDLWRTQDFVAVGELSPRGKDTPAWRAQVTAFVDAIVPGSVAGVLVGNADRVERVEVSGELGSSVTDDGRAYLTREAHFVGSWDRSDFAIPATLQDPRSVFETNLAASPGSAR
ncbi:MSMEG_6728 family protein [Amnibacterium flavum]|uniref:Uncharacterized protein n=1 Tax=Amnibacterium flavum TaxID=2173173 RepID=A0A2V1HTT8_9MICO|nr:MSMEG_6728 family protein [Amnibacterium flavum]PVZ94459.1 hypothetical protein DDQ50_12170 [Amnibacterium flavum]